MFANLFLICVRGTSSSIHLFNPVQSLVFSIFVLFSIAHWINKGKRRRCSYRITNHLGPMCIQRIDNHLRLKKQAHIWWYPFKISGINLTRAARASRLAERPSKRSYVMIMTARRTGSRWSCRLLLPSSTANSSSRAPASASMAVLLTLMTLMCKYSYSQQLNNNHRLISKILDNHCHEIS